MCTAFLDRPNIAVLMGQLGRSKNAAHMYFVPRNTTKLTTKRRYQSRRCGDDSHPGEEIYTTSGDRCESVVHVTSGTAK